ncbi:hypothetical protein H6P81_019070 [Aristolochia fimbriata]|uniref:Uncharacterized protein n=1 Tax=Aristolochia fimbriata TaxID=158543 RepID=A0AAV7E5T4_ARIFI|nr:hypothetical protein H6P81_019070 [Aristolochia fimbriata]
MPRNSSQAINLGWPRHFVGPICRGNRSMSTFLLVTNAASRINIAKGLLQSNISHYTFFFSRLHLKPSVAAMLSPKRLLTKARNGQISDFERQRKISEKGHFVVYSVDEVRFEVPLIHLSNAIFQELLKMSEDESHCAAMLSSSSTSFR